VVTFDDLTERRRWRLGSGPDRLAALGRFTAGIAHEIRNPLTGIGTGVQYLARHLARDEDQKQNLDFIQSEIGRLDRIVEDLFRVTHPHPLQKTPEEPIRLLERAVRSLGELPELSGVKIVFHLAPGLPSIPVDPDQIQQVLLNLLKNAVEASPPGGTVEVHGYAAAGESRPHLVLQVRDGGAGIDGESLARIFEPFFTKGKPKGTGLGLYVSHGIVERHGGELLAANGSDGGAILTLKLPVDNTDTVEMLR
jgi:signal transduction histidine kinase